ncbi:MAG: MFS transporter [Coriobacteriales bacterium]|nr:MFS transporter [Coriobacteriales bacterium]
MGVEAGERVVEAAEVAEEGEGTLSNTGTADSISVESSRRATRPPLQPLWTQGFILAISVNFLNFVGMQMLPSMLPVFILSLGAPSYLLGTVAGVFAVASLVARPLSGLAVDRYGRRGVLVSGTVGMILTCLALAVFPLVGAIIAVRFIQGLAWGAANTATSAVCADNIPAERHAEGFGYLGMTNSLALIIAPAISLTVFYSIGGVYSCLICGFFFLLSLLLSCCITYRKIPKLHRGQERKPDASGFSARVVLKDLLDTRALPAALLLFFVACAYGVLSTFLPAMLDERGVEGIAAFFSLSAVFAVFARPLFGRWTDRAGFTWPVITGFVCLGLGMALLNFSYSLPLLLVAAVLQGIGHSSSFSTLYAMSAKGIEPERRGRAMATAMIGFDVGVGTGALLFGLLAGMTGYGSLFLGASALCGVGVCCYLVLRRAYAALR